ncbi:MAG: hypothetical protein R3C28_31700 [Pirellulaceae bacterium]
MRKKVAGFPKQNWIKVDFSRSYIKRDDPMTLAEHRTRFVRKL